MRQHDILELWDDTVTKISRSVARDYPGIEAEDISQHLYLTVLENRTELASPDLSGATGAVWRVAKVYAQKQRAEGLYLSAQYAYRPEDVRNILEQTFNPEEWPDTVVPDDARSIKDSADELDLQSDVKWAWSQLSREHKAIIFRRYGLKDDLDSTERTRLSRAIDRLVEILNTYPRPGHPRRAVTNTRAQHIIGGSYE